MKTYKVYKIRLYPDEKQAILIHKTFGYVRLVYNYYLAQQQKVICLILSFCPVYSNKNNVELFLKRGIKMDQEKIGKFIAKLRKEKKYDTRTISGKNGSNK